MAQRKAKPMAPKEKVKKEPLHRELTASHHSSIVEEWRGKIRLLAKAYHTRAQRPTTWRSAAELCPRLAGPNVGEESGCPAP